MLLLDLIDRTSFLIIILITQSISTSVLAVKCLNKPKVSPKYYLMERCHRSNVGVVSYSNYTSLGSCQRLGVERKGLAINFIPPEAWNKKINYTCEILKCAETVGRNTLVNDTMYDFYSLYAKPLPYINTTCLPSLGMFYLMTKKMNYTEARGACKNMTGVLADVIDEERTDALAQLLSGANIESAFVGLRRYNTSSYVGENGNSIDCTTYRAWAPGHPRQYIAEYNCMLITRNKTWESTSCIKTYPSLCELLPGGPYKKRKILSPRIPVVLGFSNV